MLRWALGHLILLNLLAWCHVRAQTANGLKTFEVASVKRSIPNSEGRPSIRGGPGSSTPGQFIATGVSLRDLLLVAFELHTYQLYGPSWLGLEHYDIIANVPPGTTKKDFEVMQQSLPVDRFGLKFHWAEREITGYALIVDDGGPRIKDVSNDGTNTPVSVPAPSMEPAAPRPVAGRDGLLIVAPGETRVSSYYGGISAGIIAANAPMGRVAAALSGLLKSEVVDQTGLVGKFTFRLDFLNPNRSLSQEQLDKAGNLADFFTALREQLGLKADRRRIRVKELVVDHASKTPVEN